MDTVLDIFRNWVYSSDVTTTNTTTESKTMSNVQSRILMASTEAITLINGGCDIYEAAYTAGDMFGLSYDEDAMDRVFNVLAIEFPRW